MHKQKIRVGSRESKLAVVQTKLVMDQIAAAHPELDLELVTMKTTGDIILDRSLDQVGGKGLFVKELDRALRDRRVDITVHSLKDMPMETPEDLPLVAFSKRANPLDALILPVGAKALDPAKPLGCSSARRVLQLRKLYPDQETKLVRGNVITRLHKLDTGEYGALLLACAGLERLGLSHRISRVFTDEEMIPAAGQGILAIQGRAGEDYGFLSCVDDLEARCCALAERAFVRTLDGGCTSPIAAHAKRLEDGQLKLTGLYVDETSGRHTVGSISGAPEDAELLGRELANKLKGEVADEW
ncbi:hydroxymethylbilane synthase [Ligaoa zhengdingensis]|uniref:hydroxymethylbilane synthase n=1 Tax=Ligaoa zhengdingensis TaxID=2763658 RepID=UPI0031BA23E5